MNLVKNVKALMNALKFMISAWYFGRAYIDLDGCLLHRMRCPESVPASDRLIWWTANLKPTPIVYPRLVLLYVLRVLGVRLQIWTNRSGQHMAVTEQALGRHMWLFDDGWFCDGKKDEARLWGPVMDDQQKYVDCGKRWSLLVEQK